MTVPSRRMRPAAVLALPLLMIIMACAQSGPDSLTTPTPTDSSPAYTCSSSCMFETRDLAVTTGPGWQLERKETNLIALTTAHGELTLGVSALNQPQGPNDLLQMDLADARKRDPHARICAGPEAMPMPNGPANGQIAVLCYLSPATQGQPAFDAAALWIEAVDSSATIDFAIRLSMPVANADVFEQEALPVIHTVAWKVSSPSAAPPSDATFYPPPQQQLCFTDPKTGTMHCTP